MTTIDLVYFNAGGGHRASAMALQSVIESQGRPWQVRLVNLLEILDPQDVFRRVTGMGPEDLYNKRLARGWTLGLAQELKLLQGMIRLGHPTLVKALRQHWLKTEPDLVVSLVPNFNRALYHSLIATQPGVPFVTVLTDLADFPPNFWIEPGQRQHLVCGSSMATRQARAAGYPRQWIHRTSGMIIRPDFYTPRQTDVRQAKREMGFDPDRPVGLVMFGGQGSRAMLGIASRLAHTQLIMVCGHNATLAKALRERPTQAPHHVVEFTADIAGLMQCADFFIGKPGPGSLSEAVQQRLPVIVVRNRWTMPQERFNTQWVLDNGYGLVLPSFGNIREAVDRMVDQLPAFALNLRRNENRAVYEIPVVLEHVLGQAKRAVAQPHADAKAGRDSKVPATA